MEKPKNISWEEINREIRETMTETDNLSNVICPFCGELLHISSNYFDNTIDNDYDIYSCDRCENAFVLSKKVNVIYTASKLDSDVIEELKTKNKNNEKVKS
jgi:hypothetical protein